LNRPFVIINTVYNETSSLNYSYKYVGLSFEVIVIWMDSLYVLSSEPRASFLKKRTKV